MNAVFLLIATALAQDPGTVLAIEGPRFYCDLAAEDGLRPGDTVLLYRNVELVYDGQRLGDPFYLGEASVIEVGGTLSLIQADPSLMLSVGVGDVVAIEPLSRPAPAERAAPVVAETEVRTETVVREVMPEDIEAYIEAAASPPDTRTEALRAWLEAYPDSPLASSVDREVTPLVTAAPAAPDAVPLFLQAVAASEVDEGAPLTVSVTVPDTSRVDSAQLFFRRDGETTFRQRAMTANGDVTFVGRVPEESTVFPSIEWYVAVQDTDGALHQSEPALAVVARELGSDGSGGRDSEIAVRYEYVEFWWANPGLDRFHHGEAEFTYRMRFHGIHAFRVGYGAYSGDGGITAQLDGAETPAQAEDASRPIGWQYGYTELEVHPVPAFGLMLRTSVGIDLAGINGGVGGRVRIGYEEGTNLQLGAGRSWAVGDEYIVGLAWNTIPRVPMLASVQVTNKPGLSPDDWGVRLIWEPRLQIRPAFEAGFRVGYQLRNTNHLGPAVGGAMVFRW
jgi:hypothetical protein